MRIKKKRMIKSRLNYVLFPLTILIGICSAFLFFIAYIMIINNLSKMSLDVIIGILFVTWFAVFPLGMVIQMAVRNYVIDSNKLEVVYLFGLIRFFYNYNDLKISDYSWRGVDGLLIELPDGEQMTIGINQYRNYNEIKESLESRIKKEKIEVKYTNQFTRIMFVIGGVLLIALIILLKLKK